MLHKYSFTTCTESIWAHISILSTSNTILQFGCLWRTIFFGRAISSALSFKLVVTCYLLFRSWVTRFDQWNLIQSRAQSPNQSQGWWVKYKGQNQLATTHHGHPAWIASRYWKIGMSTVIHIVSQSNKLCKWVGSSQVITAGFDSNKHAVKSEGLISLAMHSTSFYVSAPIVALIMQCLLKV